MVTWGTFPRGCKGTVTHGRLLDKGGGVLVAHVVYKLQTSALLRASALPRA